MCALDRYRDHLEALERQGLPLSGASALKWGQEFDRYRVAVWESLVTQGFLVRDSPLIGGEGAHVYKLPDTDRYQIWVEKRFTDREGKAWRGDNVIFDLEAKRAVMVDVTSRSPDDPVVLRRARLRFEGEGALEHDATNRLRAKALEDLIRQKRPDLGEFHVEPVTPEGYRTFTERVISERRSAARTRLSGSGPGPATAFIASIVVSMVVTQLLTAEQARAEESIETNRAARTLERMVRAYASGDLDLGKQLRGQWDSGEDLIWVNGLPLPSDLNRVKLLEQIRAQLDKIESEGRAAHACLQACRKAEQQVVSRIREAEASAKSAVDQLRRAHEEAYADIDRRIERWRVDLMPLRARKGTTSFSTTWGEAKWDEIESVISADYALSAIRDNKKEGEEQINAIQAGTLDFDAARGRIQDLVAYSLYDYWTRFAVRAVQWVHHGIQLEHSEEIQALSKEYDTASKALDARSPPATAEDHLALDRSFRAREEPMTNSLASRYRALYDRFAAETIEVANAIRTVAPDLATERADAIVPNGLDWQLMNQGSYTYSKNIYYANESLRIPTRFFWAEDSFKQVLPDAPVTPSGNLARVTAWINATQIDLKKVNTIREGSRLVFWGESLPQGTPPPAPEWPIGPPPETTHASGTWTLESATPNRGTGPAFRAEAPLLRGKLPVSSVLRFQGANGALLLQPITFTQNSPPVICVDVQNARETRPTVIAWHITDPDPYDTIRWTVSIDGVKDDAKGEGQTGDGVRVVTWDKAGNYRIRASADDGLDRREATYVVKVEPNHPPTIVAGMVVSSLNHIPVGEPFEVRVVATDPDPDEDLRFVLQTPKGLVGLGEESCEPSTAGWTCTGLARADVPGRYKITATVTDPSGASDTMTFDVFAEE
jgi:hypothetical protein